MGSVQFQRPPWSSLYFSRSIGPFQCIPCYLQGFNLSHLSLSKWFPLFILTSSVCWSLQCLISTLTEGGKGGHLFRLTCSVVLWGGRNTANKYHWHVWGVLSVSALPRFEQLRQPGAWLAQSPQVCGVSYHILGRGCLSGAEIVPFQLSLPATCLSVSCGGWAGL